MKTLALLVIHVLTTLAKHAGPGGGKAIIAESVLLKYQQLIAHRSNGKTPRLTTSDRFLCGLLTLFMRPGRIRKAAVILKPATLTKFRSALLSRNYHRLFSSQKNRKPGPKGPSENLVRVIVELKRRNARYGCPRIAQQINKAFGVNIDKDVVRRVLAKHYHPEPYDGGPSWLTFLRHTRDSFFSIALFRRKSILKNSPALLAISQYARHLIGYGISVCHFNQSVIFTLFDDVIPMFDASRSLRSIHDQSFSHHRCRRKLLGLAGTGTVTILPRSPPVAARRIRTRRHKHHDYRSNYGSIDLEVAHRALNNSCHLFLIPSPLDEKRSTRINIATAISQAESENFTRKKHCLEELRTLIAA
jgi:putative transposase